MEKMTIAQLKTILDDKQIAYKSRATKAELIALLEKSKKPVTVSKSPRPGEY